jgi:hypothetical protein
MASDGTSDSRKQDAAQQQSEAGRQQKRAQGIASYLSLHAEFQARIAARSAADGCGSRHSARFPLSRFSQALSQLCRGRVLAPLDAHRVRLLLFTHVSHAETLCGLEMILR